MTPSENHDGPAALARGGWPVLAAGLLAALVLGLIPFARDLLLNRQATAERTRANASAVALAEGLRLAGSGAHEKAFTALRRALDSALTPESKNDAALAIGEFLAEQAREEPAYRGLPARQYLRIVLAIDPRPEQRRRALRTLLEVAFIRKDLDDLRTVCEDIRRTDLPVEERTALLLRQLDAVMELGSWNDLTTLLVESRPYGKNPKYKAEFTLRWASVGEQILNRKDLFEAWRADYTARRGTAPDSELRQHLVTATVSRLTAIAASTRDSTAEEAGFRAIRLLLQNGQHDEASQRLDAFLLRDPGLRSKDALLLAIDLARREDRRDAFLDLTQRYINRFGWDSGVESAFFEMVEMLKSEKETALALTLMKKNMRKVTEPALKARLLLSLGNLSHELLDYSASEAFFEQLMAIPEAVAQAPAVLIARGENCADCGDMEGAGKWLLEYLNRFPKDRSSTDAAFRLLGKLRAGTDGGSIDVIVAASAMTTRFPDDLSTAASLALAAQRMEALGLPALAHEYYTRATLLQCVRGPGPGDAGPMDESVLHQTTLANARCLLAISQPVEANRLLRKLCGTLPPGTTRSAAASLWAEMALDEGQRREGERRIGLIVPDGTGPDIDWRVRMDRLMQEVASGTNSTRAVGALLAAAAEPSAGRYPELVHKAYQAGFERMAATGDTAGLRSAFEVARTNASALPLDEYRLLVAKSFLARADYPGAAEWLREGQAELATAITDINRISQTVRRYQ